jgi:HK97 family phage portal protein
MPNVITRALISAGQSIGLLGRPWPGLNLPMRTMWGPGPAAHMLRDDDGSADSLPAVIGALSLLCDALTALNWEIVKRGDPRAGVEVVSDNLDAVYALQRWPLHERWAWTYSALLSGNGIAHVIRNGRDRPAYLRVYPAQRVSYRLYENGALSLLLTPPSMGEVREVSEGECAVLRYRPSGFDERIGISPLLQASPTIDLLLQNRSAVRSTMRNAARPSGYLSTDAKLDPDKAEAIKTRWNATHGGAGRGGTAVLEQGLKYATIPLNDLQELAANQTAQLGVGDVARLYNIPPSLLIGTEQNRATATEDRRRLLSFAVEPLGRIAEDALTRALLTAEQRAEGFSVRIDTSIAMLGQGNEMAEAISKLLNSGAVSINEARARLGLGSVEHGDELRSPANTYPLRSWIDAKPRAEPAPAESQPGSGGGQP